MVSMSWMSYPRLLLSRRIFESKIGDSLVDYRNGVIINCLQSQATNKPVFVVFKNGEEMFRRADRTSVIKHLLRKFSNINVVSFQSFALYALGIDGDQHIEIERKKLFA